MVDNGTGTKSSSEAAGILWRQSGLAVPVLNEIRPKRKLSLAENFYSPEHPESRGSKLQVPVLTVTF